jgi:hypothetical protein
MTHNKYSIAQAFDRSVIDLACLPHEAQVAAIMTASPEALKTARAKLNNAKMRKPKKLRPCPKCGVQLGAREMRLHKCG